MSMFSALLVYNTISWTHNISWCVFMHFAHRDRTCASRIWIKWIFLTCTSNPGNFLSWIICILLNKVILELYKQCFWLLHYFSLSFFTHSATQLPTRRFSYPNMLLHAYIQAWTSNVDYMHMFHVYLHRMWITRSCSISTSRLHYQFGNLSVLLNKKISLLLYH